MRNWCLHYIECSRTVRNRVILKLSRKLFLPLPWRASVPHLLTPFASSLPLALSTLVVQPLVGFHHERSLAGCRLRCTKASAQFGSQYTEVSPVCCRRRFREAGWIGRPNPTPLLGRRVHRLTCAATHRTTGPDQSFLSATWLRRITKLVGTRTYEQAYTTLLHGVIHVHSSGDELVYWYTTGKKFLDNRAMCCIYVR